MKAVAAGPNARSDEIYRKVTRRLVPFLFIGYVLAYLDRGNVGYAKLGFMGDLGFNEAIFGLGGGLFYLGYSLFEVPSNLLLSKIGARRTIARIMILWGLAASAFAFMSRPEHYYVLRFLLGAAEAGFFPGVLLYISRWIPITRRAHFTALFMAAMPISGVIGGPLAGVIMETMDGFLGVQGWRWLFLVEGLPAVVFAFVVYKVLADRPSEAKWLTAEEARILESELGTSAVPTKAAVPAWSFLRERETYALGLMAAALIAGLGGISLWLPTLVRGIGADGMIQIGLITVLPYAAGLAAQQIVARKSDRMGSRRRPLLLAGLVGATGWFVIPMADTDPILSVIAMCLAVGGMFAATGPFWALVTQNFGPKAAPAGIATVTTMGSLAGFLVPTLVGRLETVTGSLDWGLGFYGALLLVGTLTATIRFGNRHIA